jgi:crotonobetainyl-CoA:carnitine CoA-transferase CaiB-like acyl-CoA transferase
MQRLGLDEPTIRASNPNLVYCSISGYGQSGPRAHLPGHDVNYQAWGGTLNPDGRPATMPPLPMADLASGMAAAFGICAALLGGQGAYLDLAMTDVMATWTGNVGHTTSPDSTSLDTTTPKPVPGYGLFFTANGTQIALGVVNENHFWSALCHAIGLDRHADLTFAERSARGAELQNAVNGAIVRHDRDTLVKTLIEAGVPAAPVLDRAAMVATAPFPSFPIRWNEAQPTGEVPTVDQHRGQGFLTSP